jgi:hypothetical protein
LAIAREAFCWIEVAFADSVFWAAKRAAIIKYFEVYIPFKFIINIIK